ncbi:uroporphyrinogen-III C-methyltransferase, partial [Candidatus Albibeggiatoa sp. nov. BB20]|uniref:uroporphyrinogen-III C-methyltransferase n=1 Tax=Candidatus Albibeggiatoa sp. nov. BB20 TaxID=3162723 RepID=UPI0033653C81
IIRLKQTCKAYAMANQSDSITPLSQMPNPTGRLYPHYDEKGKVSYSTELPNAQATVSSEEKPPVNKKPRRGGSKILNTFSSLLILCLLGVSYYVFTQMYQIGEHVGQQVAIVSTSQHSAAKLNQETQQTTNDSNDTQLNMLQQAMQDLVAKQQNLEQGLSKTDLKQDEANHFIISIKEFMAATGAQLESQNQEITKIDEAVQHAKKISGKLQASQDWTLSEIGYLLNLAQHRLNFMQDSKTALSILATAKHKLQQWSQPQLSQPLIAQIEQDIATLQTMPSLDTTLISQQLSDYINQLPQLILVKAATPPPVKTTVDKQPLAVFSMLESWGDVTSVVWNEMKQLVTVNHNENVDVGLLTDSQMFFVQQGLGLKLESARLALLKSDFQAFQTILNEATAWLNQYYDQNSMQVVEMQVGLQQLQKTDFSIQYPDMTKALDILQRTQKQWHEHFVN